MHAASISKQTAHKWLSGQTVPSADKIDVLAEWLGISAHWPRFGSHGGEGLANFDDSGTRCGNDGVFFRNRHQGTGCHRHVLAPIPASEGFDSRPDPTTARRITTYPIIAIDIAFAAMGVTLECVKTSTM